MRPLVADIGEWASADPAGHRASDNLMTYAGGDPIDVTDIDGRLATQVSHAANLQAGAFEDSFINGTISLAQMAQYGLGKL